MEIDLFVYPKTHPFSMLDGYDHAFEKEQMLAWILQECINAEKWTVVTTSKSHPTMVDDGLLKKHRIGNRYSLTEKAKGLLYAYFHK